MILPQGLVRLLLSGAALALAGGGCSLLVSGDVAEFQCVGGDSSCPSGMTCSATTHRCVSGEAGIDPIDAGDEDAPVDPDAGDGGKDATDAAMPLALGQKCRIDNECKSRLCGASTILTTTITQTTGPICTTPCCNSGECPSSFVCFNGGTGGGYCVPATLALRTPPSTGGKSAGASCTASTECRSGLCTGSPKQCLDTCCSQSECAGTTTCRLKSVAAPGPSHDIWICAPAETGATKLPGDTCVDSTDCATDDCIGIGAGRICRPSCSNSASCKVVAGFTSGHCLYGSSGSDSFKFCFSGTTGSDSPAGATCMDDSTCQSDYCDAELKRCANVCGRDSDCAANETCRPSAASTPFLRCVAKP